MQTHTIVFANQKGGCGKTTTTIGLAAALAARGHATCVVDTDPQCNATDSFGVDRDELTQAGRFTLADIYLAKKPASAVVHGFGERFDQRLTLLPGHRGLTSVEKRLESDLHAALGDGTHSHLDADDIRHEHRHRLAQSLDTLNGHVDFVVIDTPPDLGYLMTSALIAADSLIIPIFPSGYDLKGLETLIRSVKKVHARHNPELHLMGVVLGNYDSRAKLDADIGTMLDDQFGEGVLFETRIGRSVRHREASVYCQTILEHAPGQRAAEQFLSLADEVIDRVGANVQSAKQEVRVGE